MPSTLKADCPYCSTRDQAFTSVGGYVQREGRAHVNALETILFRCNGCGWPTAITIELEAKQLLRTWDSGIQFTPTTDQDFMRVVGMTPDRPKHAQAPEYSPTVVAGPYEQGCRALQREDWDIAGLGLRKSLDIATKKLIQDAKPPNLDEALKLNLMKRIDWLHSAGKLTADLKEWAHTIRMDGNEAAHEEEPFNGITALELRHFTEVFLLYVFTMPGMIAARRARQAEQKVD